MTSHDPFIPGAGRTINIAAGDGAGLQTAINNAIAGDTIVLQAGQIYVAPISGDNYAISIPNWLGGGFDDNDLSTWVTITTSNLSQLPPRGTRVQPSDAPNMPLLKIPLAPTYNPGTYYFTPVFRTQAKAHHFRLVGLNTTLPEELGYLLPADPANPGATKDPGVADGSGAALIGLGIDEVTSPEEQPHHIIIDRCYLHSNDDQTLMRCVLFNCRHLIIENCYMMGAKSVDGEAQCIAGTQGLGPFWIVNNYIQGAAQNFIYGGSATGDEYWGVVPTDFFFARNHFSKPVHWFMGDPSFVPISYTYETPPAPRAWLVKNIFEFKYGQHALVEGNLLDFNWQHGQFGAAILLTYRSQAGTTNYGGWWSRNQMSNLWNHITDLIFRYNICAHSNGFISTLGVDDGSAFRTIYQSGNYLIENNFFYDSNAYWAARDEFSANATFQSFCANNTTRDLTIRNNTCIDTSTIGGMTRTAPEPALYVYDIYNSITTGWDACTPGVSCVGLFPQYLAAPYDWGTIDWDLYPDTNTGWNYKIKNNIIQYWYLSIYGASTGGNNPQLALDWFSNKPGKPLSEISHNLLIGGNASAWGTTAEVHDNYDTTDLSTAGFVNPNLSYGPPTNLAPFVIRYRNPADYQLAGSSPYLTMGDDGGPIGIKDWPTFLAKTEGCESGVWSTSLAYPDAPFSEALFLDLPTGGFTPIDPYPPFDPPPLPSGTPAPAGTFTVYGKAYMGSEVLPGVFIALTGDANLSATTDSLGSYRFPDLPGGNYTVTPTLAGYAFTPASRSFAGGNQSAPPQSNQSDQIANFLMRVTAEPPPTPPTLSNISPGSGNAGTSIVVTITGENLTGGVVSVSGTNILVTGVSSTATQISATLSISPSAATGPRNITVTTGGGTSAPLSFTVNAAPQPSGGIVITNVRLMTSIPAGLLEIDGSVNLVGMPAPQYLINGVPIGGGGGAGNPAGPNNSIQFNSSGVFGGSIDLRWQNYALVVEDPGKPDWISLSPYTLWSDHSDLIIGTGNAWMALYAEQGVGVNTAPNVSYALDVDGDVNISGVYRVNGVPIGGGGGGSQTPWLSNIDAAGYVLYNVGQIGIGKAPAAGILLDVAGGANFYGLVGIYGVAEELALYVNGGIQSRAIACSQIGVGKFAAAGVPLDVVGDVDITGQYKINGVPIGGSQWIDTPAGGIYYNGRVNIGPSGTIGVEIGYNPASTFGGIENFNYDANVYEPIYIAGSVILLNHPTHDVFPIPGFVGIGLNNPQYSLDILGDVNITGQYRVNGVPIGAAGFQLPDLRSTPPAAGSHELWYDPADGNTVKFQS